MKLEGLSGLNAVGNKGATIPFDEPSSYSLNLEVILIGRDKFTFLSSEICLLTNARRVASVRAETYCNLYALDRLSFQEVLQNYPFMRRTLESVAAERLYQLGRDPLQVIHRKNIKEDLEIVKEIVSLVSPFKPSILNRVF
ncbi:unnamed protein product [Dibothriocephalus latus]|uniref:Cyclic nucleotide-binding domain-containing protein n=1 Tax=Dibothriocephalus latus TaxID=60516 RepID=A0A3P7P4A0_DIBLA|nr:unnamed protein product [Dibothriocephalus latus]